MPTNILQRALVDASPTSLLGEIFGGGVVRGSFFIIIIFFDILHTDTVASYDTTALKYVVDGRAWDDDSQLRVHRSTSSHISGASGFNYPGEVFGHTTGTRALLRAAGHSARQFMPNSFGPLFGSGLSHHRTSSNSSSSSLSSKMASVWCMSLTVGPF